MITVTIMINGRTIVARSAVNRSPRDLPDTERHRYEVDDGSVIFHRRIDGPAKLAIRMLETVTDIGG